jgi:hypothetical protein
MPSSVSEAWSCTILMKTFCLFLNSFRIKYLL